MADNNLEIVVGGAAPLPNPVGLTRSQRPLTPEVALWVLLQRSAQRTSFDQYVQFMDAVFCGEAASRDPNGPARNAGHLNLPFPGVDAYRLLKAATEVFLLDRCASVVNFKSLAEQFTQRFGEFSLKPDDVDNLWAQYLGTLQGATPDTKLPEETSDMLPYLRLIRSKLRDVPLREDIGEKSDNCIGIIESKLTQPLLIELIWSYWQEEGMLVQTMNAISMRFQNRRSSTRQDPLAHLEIDPLRPLNNLLWGYIQDEQHRLSVKRRAYEYDHHYGLTLHGMAVGTIRSAESRSKFLEAFHHLLHLCSIFFKEDDDTTVIADGFPVLNGAKEVHLLLTEGQHNQYGDLPWTARMEMLMQQWLLARPEMREFLPSRVMVAYPEPWMDRVDSMKRLQGWTDVSVMHFRDLAVFGEQIFLSLRFGAWSTAFDADVAANWARAFRPQVQSYIHSYRAVTGVDLSSEPVDATPPAVHLRRRLAEQRRVT